jgi:hypothetical protein
MKLLRNFAMLMAIIFVVSGTLRADEMNKKTTFTFSTSVQVPGMTLPPGTYVFKRLNNDTYPHVVQIFNEDETKLITTVMAINNEQLQASGKTILTYGEAPDGQPVPLEAWFYPGDLFGQQFVYPESMANRLSALNSVKVPSTGSEEVYSAQDSTAATTPAPAATPATTTTPAETETPAPTTYASNSSPAPVTPAPQATNELPHTASSLPLLALIGFISLSGIVVLRKVARESV